MIPKKSWSLAEIDANRAALDLTRSLRPPNKGAMNDIYSQHTIKRTESCGPPILPACRIPVSRYPNDPVSYSTVCAIFPIIRACCLALSRSGMNYPTIFGIYNGISKPWASLPSDLSDGLLSARYGVKTTLHDSKYGVSNTRVKNEENNYYSTKSGLLQSVIRKTKVFRQPCPVTEWCYGQFTATAVSWSSHQSFHQLQSQQSINRQLFNSCSSLQSG